MDLFFGLQGTSRQFISPLQKLSIKIADAAPEKSINSWNYIKQHFVDYINGGWWSLALESGEPAGSDKAGYRTCPYHNGRMCLEVIERLGE